RARPVLHARARGTPAAPRRGRHPRARKPARARRARAQRRVRGTVGRQGPRDIGRRRTRTRSAPRRPQAHAGRLGLRRQGLRRRERRLGLDLCFGGVAVTEQVVAYQRKHITTQETIDLVALDLPETTFETEAVWYLPTDAQLDGLDTVPKLLGALHAAEHTMIALLPLWAMCDRWDIGGLSTNIHFQTGRPTVFIYDGHAGGVGIAERGFDVFEGWVEDTVRLLERCPCEQGCPSCVQSPKCGNLNEMLDKGGALTLLRRLLRG